MKVSESATVSGFILPGNHRSPRYAITYDAVYTLARRTGLAPPRKNQELSATILTIRERRKTSQAVFRVGNGPGRGLSLLHASCRGETARQRFRQKPP